MHKLQEAHTLWQAKIPLPMVIRRGKKTITADAHGWEEAHEILTKEFDRLFDEEREKYGPLPNECERMFLGYLRRWKDDADKFRLATLHDGSPAIEFLVEWPLKKFGVKAPFKGRVDIMVEDLEYGGLWIRDAKWMKVIPGPDDRMMSPQNIMYSWVGRKMGYDLRGFIYDYGRTKAPTIPRILKNGTVSVAKSMDTDVSTYLQQIKEAHGDRWRDWLNHYKPKLRELKEREVTWFDRERIPIEGPRMRQGFLEYVYACQEIENRGRPIRTFMRGCRWDCEYYEPCVAQFQGLDISGLMSSQFTLEDERYSLDEESSSS